MKQRLKNFIKNSPFLMKLVRMKQTNSAFKPTYTKKIKGTGNKLTFDSSALFIECKIGIEGNNNEIVVKDTTVLTGLRIQIFGNNNRVEISSGVVFNHPSTFWMEDDNGLISIGERSAFEATDIAVSEPGKKVIIGKDCLFSYDIDIRTGDSHSIIDLTTNKRNNYAQDITISDRVWVGAHVSMLKGTVIGPDSIVATRSLVSKRFEQSNVLVGGVPAKVLKEKVKWLRERTYEDESSD